MDINQDMGTEQSQRDTYRFERSQDDIINDNNTDYNSHTPLSTDQAISFTPSSTTRSSNQINSEGTPYTSISQSTPLEHEYDLQFGIDNQELDFDDMMTLNDFQSSQTPLALLDSDSAFTSTTSTSNSSLPSIPSTQASANPSLTTSSALDNNQYFVFNSEGKLELDPNKYETICSDTANSVATAARSKNSSTNKKKYTNKKDDTDTDADSPYVNNVSQNKSKSKKASASTDDLEIDEDTDLEQPELAPEIPQEELTLEIIRKRLHKIRCTQKHPLTTSYYKELKANFKKSHMHTKKDAMILENYEKNFTPDLKPLCLKCKKFTTSTLFLTLDDIKTVLYDHYYKVHNNETNNLIALYDTNPTPFFRVQKINCYLVFIPGIATPILTKSYTKKISSSWYKQISSNNNYPPLDWNKIKNRRYQIRCSKGYSYSYVRLNHLKEEFKTHKYHTKHSHNPADKIALELLEKNTNKDLRPYCPKCDKTIGVNLYYTPAEIREVLRRHYNDTKDSKHNDFSSQDVLNNPQKYMCHYELVGSQNTPSALQPASIAQNNALPDNSSTENSSAIHTTIQPSSSVQSTPLRNNLNEVILQTTPSPNMGIDGGFTEPELLINNERNKTPEITSEPAITEAIVSQPKALPLEVERANNNALTANNNTALSAPILLAITTTQLMQLTSSDCSTINDNLPTPKKYSLQCSKGGIIGDDDLKIFTTKFNNHRHTDADSNNYLEYRKRLVNPNKRKADTVLTNDSKRNKITKSATDIVDLT